MYFSQIAGLINNAHRPTKMNLSNVLEENQGGMDCNCLRNMELFVKVCGSMILWILNIGGPLSTCPSHLSFISSKTRKIATKFWKAQFFFPLNIKLWTRKLRYVCSILSKKVCLLHLSNYDVDSGKIQILKLLQVTSQRQSDCLPQ